MDTKLDQYKIFIEAAKCLSFSKAAQNLYMSQSAISQSMTALENQLDTTLFIRSRKGVTLTHEGEMMFEKISHALDMIMSAENELTNMKELKTGELTIGTGDTICQHYLMPFIAKYKELFPQVHIHIINGTTEETIEHLKQRHIDLAFINYPYRDKSITYVPTKEVHDIFISGDKDEHIYTLKELASQRLVMLERLSTSRQYVDDFFHKYKIELHPAYELGAHDLLISFAKYKMGIACVTKEFCDDLNKDIFEIKIDPPLGSRSIGYAYLSSIPLPITVNKFIEVINETI